MSGEYSSFDTEGKAKFPNPPPPTPVVLQHRVIPNPGPLGLNAFAMTTFVLSLHNMGAGVDAMGPNNIVVGLAIFFGGVIQLLAGMLEYAAGNLLGATTFSSYSGFWLSYAMIFIPGTGIADAYEGTDYFQHSMAIFMIGWIVISVLFTIAHLRTNICMIALFGSLIITLVLLTVGSYHTSKHILVSAGVFGLITSLIGWYIALACLLTKETSYFVLPLGKFQ